MIKTKISVKIGRENNSSRTSLMQEIYFCPVFVFLKETPNFTTYVISTVYFTLQSIIKNFQTTRTFVIGKLKAPHLLVASFGLLKALSEILGSVSLPFQNLFIYLFLLLFIFKYFCSFCFLCLYFILTCFGGKWCKVIKQWKLTTKMHETEQRTSYVKLTNKLLYGSTFEDLI